MKILNPANYHYGDDKQSVPFAGQETHKNYILHEHLINYSMVHSEK